MTVEALSQSLQLIAWFIALVELIVALYNLVLNAWHPSNRHTSAYLLLVAANTYALGAMTGANSLQEARIPAVLLGVTTTAIQSGLLAVVIVLLKPEWRRNRMRWLLLISYLFAFLPAILTAIDLGFGTRLFYTGINPSTYSGGFLATPEYLQGSLAVPIRMIELGGFAVALLLVLLYFSFFDRQLSATSRRLARLLLVAEIAAAAGQGLLINQNIRLNGIAALVSSTIFAVAYGYASYHQMISDRRSQRGSLQIRVTGLIAVVTIPLVLAVIAFLSTQAAKQFEADASKIIDGKARSMAATSQLWLDQQAKALQSLAAMPAIQSMDSVQQRPYLQAMANAHPEIYLVSTTDLSGMNVARNDDEVPKDYSDQLWFKQAASGYPVTYQTLIGRTSNVPALVISVPIRNEHGVIVGVSMFASYLDILADEIKAARLGTTGYGYIVDENNQIIAHPDSNLVTDRLDLSDYPPISSLHSGQEGFIRFSDDIGRTWRAETIQLSNGWGVVVQQEQQELLIPLGRFQQFAGLVLVFGGLFTLFIITLTIRQSFRPIRTLLETANAIAQGDLTRVAPVESEDELGMLAKTFNAMTAQLNALILNLEERVQERTQALERRAVQLQVTAEVARESSSIRNLEELLGKTVGLISERFGFYHTGIFLLDDRGEYAVLRAANSEGGQDMLANGHKLQVGQTGLVGYVTSHGEPRIALDVGEDAVYFNNPYLPETRSEISLPLKTRGRIIGALDVQSREPAAFGPEDVEILQILADQIALAIENARLLTESQETLNELETLYGNQVRQAWQERLSNRSIAFSLDSLGVKRTPANRLTPENGKSDQQTLKAPIQLRGQPLGSLALRRSENQAPWTEDEARLVNETVQQIALALENARLLETVQRNAHHEQLVGQIAARTQSSLDLESVMKIAVQEIGLAIDAAKVQINLRNEIHTPETEQLEKVTLDSGS